MAASVTSLGEIGLVITLVCLATPIRKIAMSTQTASYQAAVRSISDLSRAIGLAPTAGRIMAECNHDRTTLDPNERRPFDALMLSTFRNYENIHFQ